MVVTGKKNTWAKSRKESAKKETEIFKRMGCLANDSKEGGGDRCRIKNILMQIRQEENEEYEARAFLEAMQKNVNEAHARASENPAKGRLRKSRNTCAPWIKNLKNHRTSVTKFGKSCKAMT